MKKVTPKTKAKATAKTTSKPAAKKTPAKKPAANKTEVAKSAKMEKLNKLERALAENQISRTEYDMWREVYAKEKLPTTQILSEKKITDPVKREEDRIRIIPLQLWHGFHWPARKNCKT